MNDLEGKTAMVTGGGGGLGREVCRVLSKAGACVAVADVREDAARRAAARLDRGLPVVMDLRDADSVRAAFTRVVDAFGRLDVLVNNAGVDHTRSVEELSLEQWDEVLDVNVRGPFLLSKLAFPVMRTQGGGHIVNVVSTAALRTWANASAYHASKWGLRALSHALHVEGRPHGIKVTAVIAGGMRTPFLLDRFPEIDPSLLQDPANVAQTVRFVLCQPTETVIPEVMVLPMRETSWP